MFISVSHICVSVSNRPTRNVTENWEIQLALVYCKYFAFVSHAISSYKDANSKWKLLSIEQCEGNLSNL